MRRPYLDAFADVPCRRLPFRIPNVLVQLATLQDGETREGEEGEGA